MDRRFGGAGSSTMKASVGRNDPSHGMLPLLSVKEETLYLRWYEHHDVGAAERPNSSQPQPATDIAMAHRRCGVVMQELISERYLGLMCAACCYDPACGKGFITCVTGSVQRAIQQSILRVALTTEADPGDVETLTAMPLLYLRRDARRTSAPFGS
jgi:DNA-directed RNA polymerase sigma subunit (sigma70/sigma32)